jgi:membrane-associated protease RseP (regulator of RpoE activity)
VHADLVLVYTTRSGEVPASVKLDRARAKQEKAQQEQINPDAPKGTLKNFDQEFYNYFASYWIKLPTPLLGVHVKQGDGEAGFPDKGLEVIAVIKGSPAAAAGLQKGDTLLRLGETELSKPELLTQAAQRYAGQKTEIVYSRLGAEQRQPVTLNARQ